MPDDSSSSSSSSTLRLLELAKPQKKLLAGAFATLSLTSSVTLSFPFLVGKIIDSAIDNPTMVDPTYAAAGLFGMISAAGAGVVARQIFLTKAGENIVAELRSDLFRSVLRQDNSLFDQTRTGDIITRLTSDISLIQTALTTEILNATRAVLMSVGGVSFLLVTSPTLTLVSCLSLPPIFVSAKYFGKKIKALQTTVQSDLAKTTVKAEEVISQIKTVRSFNAESFEAEAYKSRTQTVRDRAIEAGVKGAYLDGTVHVAANAGLLCILAVGGNMLGVGGGTAVITPGELASFLMYSVFVAGNVSALSTVYGSLQKSTGAAERIFELIDQQPTIMTAAKGNGQPHDPLKNNDIVLKNVSFNYPTRQKYEVLSNLSLELPQGSHTAIVGSSGSGKSTISQILLRLYDVNSGSITIGGRSIRELPPETLRDLISVVQQEPVLFSSSIADNIRYGNLEASEEEVYEAAKSANVTDFAETFPDKLDTLVGEKGVQLSGGQKQRVAIARVLLRNSPIVIFDEATSALDAESEFLVTKAIEQIVEGRTVISIAHRLSTIRKAQQVAVIENGAVVEVGNVKDLINLEGGKFNELIQRQR
ncbi:hypothetical protein TrVE_jg12059 [Triparma verrucosa]|uniref:Uncharacterized protein n=1 Tax=Triparma verrucosa TaxID=1606542 RepID=A0A9W7BU00_9STRA|nr:hypothetical protein TrVE_jg12059 [Triparma verrucosa]